MNLKIIKYIISFGVILIAGCSFNPSKKIILNRDVFESLSAQERGSLEYEVQSDLVIIKTKEGEEEELKHKIHEASHKLGKCGGFTEDTDEEILAFSKILKEQDKLNKSFREDSVKPLVFNEDISQIIKNLDTENLKSSIELLTSYKTRSARSKTPNKPINDFTEHILSSLKNAKLEYKIKTIKHTNTRQKSINVTIKGNELPDEVVVLGGHIDSKTASFFSRKAPGADDNASGSAVILEALRGILESGIQPKRTLEFFWYAAEEEGLLGSKEIAGQYKDEGVKVISVMQLDMVLFPGNGEKIGLTEDFTNVEHTKILEQLITMYIGVGVDRFRCGYGCSDHASWHRSGFKAVFPFESNYKKRNRKIHSKKDVVNESSDFKHALKFAKLGVAFLLEFAEI